MKINVLALVTIIGCTASAVSASTCSESSGVCVCSGECPSFTADWPTQGSSTINGNTVCVSAKEASSSSYNDGVVTLNGVTYTSMDNCSDAMAAGGGSGGGNSAGMIGAYYARAFVAAAAVAGGVAYAL
jgi:hypothetical protein